MKIKQEEAAVLANEILDMLAEADYFPIGSRDTTYRTRNHKAISDIIADKNNRAWDRDQRDWVNDYGQDEPALACWLTFHDLTLLGKSIMGSPAYEQFAKEFPDPGDSFKAVIYLDDDSRDGLREIHEAGLQAVFRLDRRIDICPLKRWRRC